MSSSSTSKPPKGTADQGRLSGSSQGDAPLNPGTRAGSTSGAAPTLTKSGPGKTNLNLSNANSKNKSNVTVTTLVNNIGHDDPDQDLLLPDAVIINDSYRFLCSLQDELLRSTLFAASLEIGWSESSFCKVLHKLWNILGVRSSSDLRRLLGSKDDAQSKLKDRNRKLFKPTTYAVLERHLTRTGEVKLNNSRSQQKKNQLEIELEKTNKFQPVKPDPPRSPPPYVKPKVLVDKQRGKINLRPRSTKILTECASELQLAHSESEKIFEMITT